MRIRKLVPPDTRRAFRSGDDDLDTYLRRYAGKNQLKLHIGVTYIAEDEVSLDLLGYATLSGGQIDSESIPKTKSLPRYPLPILRIARLAVSREHQGQRTGTGLLGFAISVALRMRDDTGCVGLLVDAKPNAVRFYAKQAFVQIAEPKSSGTTLMFLPLGTVDAEIP